MDYSKSSAADLQSRAKDEFTAGNYKKSLSLLIEAQKLDPCDKLARKINRIKDFIAEDQENINGASPEPEVQLSKKVEVAKGFTMPRKVWDKLYLHQQEGLRWLWSLQRAGRGGILADDMGLGKTIQMIVFLSEMMALEKAKSALIVVPVSMVTIWQAEFKKWKPEIPVYLYFAQTSRTERDRYLAKVRRRGGVMIITYGLVVTNWEDLGNEDHSWDYVILDEGHKIKNPSTKSAKALQSIKSRVRIVITGTAVQNNLLELWALFDFVQHGTLLGSKTTFKIEYSGPIERARQKDATPYEQSYGEKMAGSLRKLIQPFFLRRTKAQVMAMDKEDAKKCELAAANPDPNEDPTVAALAGRLLRMPSLTRKNDLVVWLHLSPTQQTIYRDFLQLDEVKQLLTQSVKRSPLMELTILKKLCDHPRLLSRDQCTELGLAHNDSTDEGETGGSECAANRIHNVPDEVLINESCKLEFLIELLDHLRDSSHRCLVFSQSRKILDVLYRILTNRGHVVARLDGTITKLCERQEIIDKFTRDKSYTVFLLTTQVGGVGLTLTSADRVVIFDPSWNPATDAQAVDRAFRIGQTKNVVIYRLITCGTVEEKIYRRQIFKDSITRQTTGINMKTDANPYRYFTHQDLHELFSLDDPFHSKTQVQLAELHRGQRHTDPSLDDHLAYLHSLSIFGISDHDLMFSAQEAPPPSNLDMVLDPTLVEARRIKAEQMLAKESASNDAERDLRYQMNRMNLTGVNQTTISGASTSTGLGRWLQRVPPEELSLPPTGIFRPQDHRKPMNPVKPSSTSNQPFEFTFDRPVPKPKPMPSLFKPPILPLPQSSTPTSKAPGAVPTAKFDTSAYRDRSKRQGSSSEDELDSATKGDSSRNVITVSSDDEEYSDSDGPLIHTGAEISGVTKGDDDEDFDGSLVQSGAEISGRAKFVEKISDSDSSDNEVVDESTSNSPLTHRRNLDRKNQLLDDESDEEERGENENAQKSKSVQPEAGEVLNADENEIRNARVSYNARISGAQVQPSDVEDNDETNSSDNSASRGDFVDLDLDDMEDLEDDVIHSNASLQNILTDSFARKRQGIPKTPMTDEMMFPSDSQLDDIATVQLNDSSFQDPSFDLSKIPDVNQESGSSLCNESTVLIENSVDDTQLLSCDESVVFLTGDRIPETPLRKSKTKDDKSFEF